MKSFKRYSPSSSENTVLHRRKYHVFLSFRGLDTRKFLVDHLFQSLLAAGFNVFLDTEKLEKGENIGTSLKEAIQDSTVRIPIFSSNYASSPWCLDELSLIWTSTCPGTRTIPLFYDVEPSVVRYQTGIYKESWEALRAKGRHSTTEMEKWKEALHNVSLLSGWSLSLTADRYEGRLVKLVVKDLLQTLKIHELHVANHPVGLSGPMEEVTKLLEMDNDIDLLTVGIWGMGGLGKTALSRAVYNKIHDQFQASCFVSDVRATAKECVKGLVNLQRQILQELVKRNTKFYSVAAGIEQMKECLASMKVLVILDDVDEKKQLDALCGDCYGPGSRIIITTRDEKVLQRGKIDKIHPMKGLSKQEAVRLFSFHAFLRACPESKYEDMTQKIVNACQGVPLSLEILGSHLYGERSMGIWTEALIKIREEVYPSLKISYDALTNEAKQIFLDIACFFVNVSNKYLIKTETFYHEFWTDLGCEYVHTSLASLKAKSLIRIDNSNRHCSFWMHDHLRDLGRQIVEDESPHDPSKRSRLWCKKDIHSVLRHTEEMPNVRGLMLTKLELHQMHNLALMHNLKFLFCLYQSHEEEETMLQRCVPYVGGSSGKYFSLPPFPGSLIHFVLEDCPEVQNLSTMSPMIKLKTLHVSLCTSLAQLPELNWMKSLRELRLFYCKNLKELPPLPESLIHIKVESCSELQKLSSVSHMIKLETLHVSSCYSLAQLPELNWMKSLRELELSSRGNLKELPPLPESLIHIKVEWCSELQKLSSVSHMIKLETLHVSCCKSLAQLPELNWMKSLRELELSWCGNLKELPPLPESLIHIKVRSCFKLQKLSSVSHMIQLEQLETLHVFNCNSLAQLPELNWMKSLRELELSCCWNLKELPPLPESLIHIKVESCSELQKLSSVFHMIKLETLHVSDCESLAQLPELSWMKSLRTLRLFDCKNLKELPQLPESLIHIKVDDCFHLQKLSSVFHMIKLETLHVSRCKSLAQLPELNWMESLRELRLIYCQNLKELPPLPESLIHIKVESCSKLQKLSSGSHIIKLETLHVSRCKSLAQLPELNWMESLRELRLIYCQNLKELPPLPESLIHIKVESCSKLQKLSSGSHIIKLETLHVSRCKSLAQLPESNWMESLRELELSCCWNLKELPPLPESVIHIKVEWCSELQKLSSVSHMIKLETLHVSSCSSLAQLPELNWMKSLRELELSWCGNLEELPPLPESLIHIKVRSCFKLQKLSSVSHMIQLEQLETLHVSDCNSLAQLPELNCMKSLRKLELSWCGNLKELPPLPESLIHIKVESCSELQKLSSVSHMIKLKTLHLSCCKSLAQLPELSWMKSLRQLKLSWCGNLKELPPLPKGLLSLILDGDEKLKESPPLPEWLITLSTQGCYELQTNASQPSTRDNGKRVASEPNNETDPSAMSYFPKRPRTVEPSPCFSVQNFFMEQGESSVPSPADPDYEIPHNVDTALSLALPDPERPPMIEASPCFLHGIAKEGNVESMGATREEAVLDVHRMSIEQDESSVPAAEDPPL